MYACVHAFKKERERERETKVISNKCFFPLINLDDNQNPAKKEPKTNRERARQKLVNLFSKKKKKKVNPTRQVIKEAITS